MEKLPIDKELLALAQLFPPTKKLYVVGGFVRDFLLNGKVLDGGDIDIASALSPDELTNLLADTQFCVTQASPRLGTMIVKGTRSYEYTTFRKDSYPEKCGAHTPCAVTFTDDIEQDCRRRDFCCNAIYFSPIDGEYVDLLGGADDIDNHLLRTTRSAEQVFHEDGLRFMRLFRFVSTLGFDIDKDAWRVCQQERDFLRDITVERIATELIKILEGDFVGKALRLMLQSGVLEVILPELASNDKTPQNAKYHKYDVLEHIFVTVENCPKNIRLAGLFHDIAKTYCRKQFGNTYDHARVGGDMTEQILGKYKFPNKVTAFTARLVREHMFGVGSHVKPTTLRRYVAKNIDIIDDIIALKRADYKGTGVDFGGENFANSLQKTKDYINERCLPTRVSRLEINGDDLVAVGVKGKNIKSALDEILDMCVLEKIANKRDVLLAYIGSHYKG
ncbi:MAG: hypothetical protein RSB10_03200 [Clostridia bacterium]